MCRTNHICGELTVIALVYSDLPLRVTDALKRVPTGIYGPLKRAQDIRPTIVPAYRCPAYKLPDENVKDQKRVQDATAVFAYKLLDENIKVHHWVPTDGDKSC